MTSATLPAGVAVDDRRLERRRQADALGGELVRRCGRLARRQPGEVDRRALEQHAQAPVIGLIELVDAGERLIDLEADAIDFLRVADDARNCP